MPPYKKNEFEAPLILGAWRGQQSYSLIRKIRECPQTAFIAENLLRQRKAGSAMKFANQGEFLEQSGK